MSNFPSLTGRQVVRVLMKAGFRKASQEGSHLKMVHADGRISVIPIHKGESIRVGLMSKILKDIKLSREEFQKLIRD